MPKVEKDHIEPQIATRPRGWVLCPGLLEFTIDGKRDFLLAKLLEFRTFLSRCIVNANVKGGVCRIQGSLGAPVPYESVVTLLVMEGLLPSIA